MENKNRSGVRTGPVPGTLLTVDSTPTPIVGCTITVSSRVAEEWEAWQPCSNCNRRRDEHSEDGKCLFEASSFTPVPFPTDLIGNMWIYEVVSSVSQPKVDYPKQTKYAERKQRRLKMKAPRRR